MYVLGIANGPTLTAAVIARRVQERINRNLDVEHGMRHLMAIERIGARGTRYSNEDFDVLSAAWHFAGCPMA